MRSFVGGPVTVEVPATSANLGPGFDCLGLALSLRDRVRLNLEPDHVEVRPGDRAHGEESE